MSLGKIVQAAWRFAALMGTIAPLNLVENLCLGNEVLPCPGRKGRFQRSEEYDQLQLEVA